MDRAMGRTGCLGKGAVHKRKIGQELRSLAKRAYAEGKICEEDWQKLPETPEGMVNLLMGPNAEKRLIDALLKTYA